MVDRCLFIMREYGLLNHDSRSPDSPPCFIDSSASGFIRSLRVAIGLPPEFEQVVDRAKRAEFRDPERMLGMVRPRAFGSVIGKAMLSQLKTMFDNGYVAVHPSFTDMIIALRSAYAEADALDNFFI
jgi:hypothetical protein